MAVALFPLTAVIDKDQLQTLSAQVLQALQQNPQGISEYDLLQLVRNHPTLQSLEGPGNQQLFRRHFVLRHCLYYLQQQLWERDKQVVRITPLTISLHPARESGSDLPGDAVDPGLRDYYLDWNNFDTTEAEVDDLLNDFWRHYVRYIQQDEAWEILNLPVGSSWGEITARYRELAARHHPDKGGDQEMFIKIRSAYESLRVTNK